MLDLGGHPWKAVADERAANRLEPDGGWGGAVVVVGDDAESGFALCRALRKRDAPVEPLLLLISGARLADLALRDELFDDFCLHPFHPRELEARLRHLFWRTGSGTTPELVQYAGLVLNLETYQAAINAPSTSPTWSTSCSSSWPSIPAGCSPARPCCRGWGYEYYGGARTVDVHVRRLPPSWVRSTPTSSPPSLGRLPLRSISLELTLSPSGLIELPSPDPPGKPRPTC
ncbi:MAG: hypothetical protein WKF43_16215 [Acidimicrobiales bacterium]